MGKRVLAASGVAAPMDGVLASGLSAAPTSADAATSSTAERTGSNEETRLLYRQVVTESDRHVVFTGDDRSGQDDCLKNAFEKKQRRPRPLQGPPQPLHRRCTRRPLVRPHVLSLHPIDQRDTKAEPLPDTGCPPRSGSRRTPRREAISPTITLHPRNHA